MRISSRPPDDADVIRARLRALMASTGASGGWMPDDDLAQAPERVGTLRSPGSARLPEAEPAAGDDRGAGWIDETDDPAWEGGEVARRLPGGLGRHRASATAVRVAPGRRGALGLWVAGLVAVLALAGWTWAERPRVEPAPPAPAGSAPTTPPVAAPSTPSVGEVARTSVPVVVSVVGLVVRPGLVTLPPGARVADAVAGAGGLLPEADPASINLAALVTDGQQVAVGVPGAAGGAPVPGGGPPPGVPAGGRVDLNTASVTELDSLPGIGPVLAQRIVDHRDRLGHFRSVDQLDDVPGIGPAIFAGLLEAVTV